MKIQILGSGCAKCRKLAEIAETAASQLGIDYEIEKITDVAKILEFGVMSTPGFVVDGKVLASGTVPGSARMKELLAKYAVR